MKKLFALLFISVLFVFNTQSLFAAEGAFKNNLLKVEVVKTGENDYDIGLYTQKVYTEPVKVVKKSDTLYYLLLPETNHSITSTPTTGAIKNVAVKSYPYAGQDMKNAYTKVAIVTSKPVNISTSLRTLDPSVSPRLDPLRLAKLDKVFERYSDRLASGNVPTPLSEFRTSQPKKPVTPTVTQPKKPAATVAAQPKKPAAQTKPAVAVAEKPQVKQPAKQVTAAKQPQPAVKQPQQTAKQPAPVKKAEQPEKIASSEAVKPAQEKPAPSTHTQDLEKQLQGQKPVEAEFHEEKPAETVDETPGQNAEPAAEKLQEPAVVDVIEVNPKTPSKQKNDLPLLAAIFIVLLFLYIQTKKRNKKQKEDADARSAASSTDIKELLKNSPAHRSQPIGPSFNQELNGFYSEQGLESGQNASQPAEQSQMSFMPAGQNAGTGQSIGQAGQNVDFAQNIDIEQNVDNVEAEQVQASLNAEVNSAKEEAQTVENETEQTEEKTPAEEQAEPNIEEAANQAPTSQQPAPSEPSVASSSVPSNYPEEEDEVIKQLYTPIEIGAPKPMPAAQNNIEADNSDEAAIISSCKLTETRGLYLTKFEGAYVLVGYIQDDIYVLHVFKEEKLNSTEITSHLAMDNDVDSIYIVNVANKRFMIKSSPYDLSLETAI